MNEESVLAANGAFYAAFEMLDLTAMESVWSARGPITCVHPSGGLIAGRERVLASWREIFHAARSIHFTLAHVRAFVAENAAWVFLEEHIEERQGDAVVRASTQVTNFFLREGAEWKLVHHHAEPATAQRPPKTASTLN